MNTLDVSKKLANYRAALLRWKKAEDKAKANNDVFAESKPEPRPESFGLGDDCDSWSKAIRGSIIGPGSVKKTEKIKPETFI